MVPFEESYLKLLIIIVQLLLPLGIKMVEKHHVTWCRVTEMSHTLTNIRNAGGHWETINCFTFHSLLKSHFTLLNILHHNLLSFYGSQIVTSYIFTRFVQFLSRKCERSSISRVAHASWMQFWSRVLLGTWTISANSNSLKTYQNCNLTRGHSNTLRILL